MFIFEVSSHLCAEMVKNLYVVLCGNYLTFGMCGDKKEKRLEIVMLCDPVYIRV